MMLDILDTVAMQVQATMYVLFCPVLQLSGARVWHGRIQAVILFVFFDFRFDFDF